MKGALRSTPNLVRIPGFTSGYDAKWVHEFCREDWQVDSVINPAVHRADGGLNGTTGAVLSARNQRSLFIEAALRVLAYALRR